MQVRRPSQESTGVPGTEFPVLGHLLPQGERRLADALRLVRERGLGMQEASEASPSGLVALRADEDVAEAVCAAAREKTGLPVVTEEIGDTWIHGVGTDPKKVSQFRELSRLRNQWLTDQRVRPDDGRLAEFSRFLLLVSEHTWGMDEKKHLNDYINYDRHQFDAARVQTNFKKFEYPGLNSGLTLPRLFEPWATRHWLMKPTCA